MRVYISADMEGITGVASLDDVSSGNPDYEAARERMHDDVNAAVEGALAAGATDVLVNDSHATMTNLQLGSLHEDSTLIRGRPKPRGMMQGLDETHDVALFVGYHAMAGTTGAVLNHTVTGSAVRRLRLDGTEVGELGWNARLAAHVGVPVGLVTGDDATAAEAERELGDVETVVVKESIGRFAATCEPASETRQAIYERAERAVRRADEDGFAQDRHDSGPVRMAVDWTTTDQARGAAEPPGIERVDGRTTAVEGETYADAYEATVAMIGVGTANSPT